MPTGYSGEGKVYNKTLGRWEKPTKTRTYDYDNVDYKSAGLIISFFRWYPDYFADCFRSPHAKYKLELPQRLMMRALARYRHTYITGVRGLTKTYVLLLEKMIEGALFPGKKARYVAPNQKQSAKLASQTFHEIERDYPLIASMWLVNNDRHDMFKITTRYGSEFTMYVTRGDTADECCGEECGQEDPPFPIDKFITEIYPTVRGERKVNQETDPVFISEKHSHIGNASSRLHKAYTKLREDCLTDMLYDSNPYEGCVLDLSWVSALMCNLRTINYFKSQKKTLSPEGWLRECCALYTGSTENPLIPEEQVTMARNLELAEFNHCGDPEAIYIISHDVSYADGRKNALCADVVLKLTRFDDETKSDSFRKQVVYAEAYPPLPDFEQARKIKRTWARYCMTGGKGTYIVVDAQAYGTGVVEELIKPANDGLPNLRTMDNNPQYASLEQKNALPVVYALKATPNGGGKDPDGEMIQYAQHEFEHGNIELLTPNIFQGLENFKNFHDIKDDSQDARIAVPYRFTEQLCQQIQNLKSEVSGFSYREKRKSMQIQRDIWSALKYALRIAFYFEKNIKSTKYRERNAWAKIAEEYENGDYGTPAKEERYGGNIRSQLLAQRRAR